MLSSDSWYPERALFIDILGVASIVSEGIAAGVKDQAASGPALWKSDAAGAHLSKVGRDRKERKHLSERSRKTNFLSKPPVRCQCEGGYFPKQPILERFPAFFGQKVPPFGRVSSALRMFRGMLLVDLRRKDGCPKA